MRNLILMSVLLVASALSFAQTTAEVEVASPAVVEGTPGPSFSAENAANSFGKFLGRMVKTPLSIGISLVSGVKTGLSDAVPATPVSSVSTRTSAPSAAPAVAIEVPASKTSTPAAVPVGIAQAFGFLMSMAKNQVVTKQAPAPVEDRSVPAVSDVALK